MRRTAIKEFMLFDPLSFNIWYLAAAVTAAALLAVALSFSGGEEEETPTDVAPVAAVSDIPAVLSERDEALQDPPDATLKTDRVDAAEEAGHTAAESIADTAEVAKRELAGIADTLITELAGATAIVSRSGRRGAVPQDADLRLRGSALSSFKASVLEGCAPLKVKLTNRSVNHSGVVWRSSDGRTADTDTVEWLFEQPGSYRIMLVASDSDGRADYSMADITVYPRPEARFDIVPVNRSVSDREVFLYNYSTGGTAFVWDMGDGNRSEQTEPVYRFNEPGTYRISLKATNQYGCSDTIYVNYEALTSDYRIEFPNAFIPNREGPTGGRYTITTAQAAQVFHPYAEGVTEYHLIVYSRTGMVLFESRDIEIGWDGYYQGKLCDPGVYIWRVKGRFANGEEFMRAGDVTLLHIDRL